MQSLRDSEVWRYGFIWPASDAVGNSIHITRTSEVNWKGRNYRILSVATPIDDVELYVGPKGRIRVFRKGKELVYKRGSGKVPK